MPLPLIISAGIGIASLIGSIASQRARARTAKRNTDLTIAANKQQAAYQYAQEQKQLELMNKYNSPESQMERFTQAGLNKNLIYQQGSPGNQTMIPKYNAPNIQYAYEPKTDIGGAITSGLNAFQMATQIQNLITQGKIQKAELVTKQAVAEYARTMQQHKLVITQYQREKLFRENIIDYALFDRLFERKDNGNLELKPGMEEKLLSFVLAKYQTPVTQLGRYQTQADIENINLEFSESMKRMGIAVPALKGFMDFLRLLLLKK